MRTLSSLIRSLWTDTGQGTLTTLYDKLTSLPVSPSGLNLIQASMATLKEVAVQTQIESKFLVLEEFASSLSEKGEGTTTEIIQQAKDMLNYVYDKTYDESTSLAAIINDLRNVSADVNICTAVGQPIFISRRIVNHPAWAGHLPSKECVFDVHLHDGEYSSEDVLFSWSIEDTYDLVCQYESTFDNLPKKVTSDFYATRDAIIADVEDGLANNEAIYTMLSKATTDGELEASKISRLLDSLGNCAFTRFIKDNLATIDAGSSTSVLALISNFMNQTKGDYVDGDDYYTPAISGSYRTDIIGSVVSLLVTVVATVLSIIFKSIAAIVAIVYQILSNLISFISNRWSLTQATITDRKSPSLVPAFNRYLLTQYDVVPNAVEAELIEDSGCSCWFDPYDPTLLHIKAKSSETEYFSQVFIAPWTRTPQARGYGYWAADTPGGGQWSYLLNGGTYYWREQIDVSDSWVASTDETLRMTLTQAILKRIFDLAARSPNPFRTNYQLLPADISVLQSGDLSAAMLRLNDAVPDLTGAQKIAILYLALCSDFSFVEAPMPINKAFSWDVLTKLYSDTSLAVLGIQNDSPTASSIFCYGNAAWTPAVDWPEVSVKAIVSAVLVTCLSVAAIAGTALVISRKAKSFATTKLAKAESNFEQAKAAYMADPSSSNQKALAKANRKLTRAWNFAGKAGLSMYNGFSTGAESVGADSAGVSGDLSLLDIASGITASPTGINRIFEKITGKTLDIS